MYTLVKLTMYAIDTFGLSNKKKKKNSGILISELCWVLRGVFRSQFICF